MKKRAISPSWNIDGDKNVTNNLGTHMGRAVLDENGEYYLSKKPAVTFDAFMEYAMRQ